MKTFRHACVLIPLVTVLAAAVTEAPRPSLEDTLVTLRTHPYAAIGMSPGELTAMLGDPSARLTPTVWVYFDFKPVNVPDREKSDALVVVFTNDRVSRLRLCPSEPVRKFIEQQENANTPAQVFAAHLPVGGGDDEVARVSRPVSRQTRVGRPVPHRPTIRRYTQVFAAK